MCTMWTQLNFDSLILELLEIQKNIYLMAGNPRKKIDINKEFIDKRLQELKFSYTVESANKDAKNAK